MANAGFVTSSRIKSSTESSGKEAGDAILKSLTNDAHLESPLVVGRQAATRLFDFCTEAWSKDSHARPKDMCSYRYRMDSGEITATVILRLPGRTNPMVVPNSQNWFRNRSNAQNAAALRALVELGVVRRPTKREEDAIFGDNLVDFHKLVAEEQSSETKTEKKSSENCTTVGRAPPQFNGPYAQYKAPMLPHPRWVGKPTWRSLKSSKSASPVSSIGSYEGCAEPTPKSYPGYHLSQRQNSGDASTLADSESSVSIRNVIVDGAQTVDRFGVRQQHHHTTAEDAAGHHGYYYAEDGYYQGPAQEASGLQQQQYGDYYHNGYYHHPMHSGVYYSVAAAPQPLSASPDGGSPYADSSYSPYSTSGYATCTTTTSVTQGHTPQFFSEGGNVASQHSTAASAPHYGSIQYHHHHPHHHQQQVSRHNTGFSEGCTGRYCPTVYGHPQQQQAMQHQHPSSGICPMPTAPSQGYNVAGIPPPPPPPLNPSQYGAYHHRGSSWDNQGEMEVVPAAAAAHSVYHTNGAPCLPCQSGYEDYQPLYYGNMMAYPNGGGTAPPPLPHNHSYGIHHHGGYMMSSGGYLPYMTQQQQPPPPPSSYQVDRQSHRVCINNDADGWTPRTGVEGGYEV